MANRDVMTLSPESNILLLNDDAKNVQDLYPNENIQINFCIQQNAYLL
jgi:hypothetical protein